MPNEYIRDHAMYGAIFGFFAMVWFGWAQENPPQSWRVRLGFGSVVSLLVLLAGIYLAIQHWQDATALTSEGVYRNFGIIVGTEVVLAGAGAAILTWRRQQEYTAAWIAFVVGVHFLPLVWIFQDTGLFLLAALVCVAAIVAALRAKKLGVSVSALTGAGVGVVILGFALRGLVLTLT